MKPIFILGVALLLIITGCVATESRSGSDHVDLIEYATDKIDVLITKREWGGFWGREGYIGFEQNRYRVGLRGNGPVFNDPIFQDNPPSIRCIGTITLDREHNKVVVNMRRIISKPGEPGKTKPHPANGTYPIQSIRKAKVGEPSLER